MFVTNPHSNLTPEQRVKAGAGTGKHGILLTKKEKARYLPEYERSKCLGGLTEHCLHLSYINL